MLEQTRLPLLDISPVLEYGSPTPLSTHWIPLHELLAHWMDAEMVLQQPAPLAPLLIAVGHALFALGRETRALRLWTKAGQQEQRGLPALITRQTRQQVVRHVQEAAHHWSRAAFALDTLHPDDLEPEALSRARQLSRIARTQQERLWQLTEEVLAEPAATVQQAQAGPVHRTPADVLADVKRGGSHEQ